MDYVVWIWIAAGILMILAELLIPGFVICFFGVAALLVALLCSFFSVPCSLQLLLFALLGVFLLLLCRKCFPQIFRGRTKTDSSDIDDDAVAGATAVVVETIAPPLPGKIDFRGSYWEATCDREVPAGSAVRILRRENLTLIVEAIEKRSSETKEN